MKPERAYWHAEQCLTGGYECDHKHRTPEVAERCLPRVPSGPGFQGAFSMARVVPGNDAARDVDAARDINDDSDD